MKKNILLSVVVPTKDRYEYLTYLVELIHEFKSDEIELVIQDNSKDNSSFLNYLEGRNFPHLSYYYEKTKLSMSENSNLAVKHAVGEYICFIGDDDGICRNIIDCVKWMKKYGYEALRSVRTAYVWGDSNKRAINNSSACVIYDKPDYSYRLLDSKKELMKILHKGFQTLDFIPILYNGIIKRSALQKVYSYGETYFPGGSPDISNGVALSFLVEKVVYLNFPVIISGTSRMTGGGVYKKKGRATTLDQVNFISQSVIDNWEKSIPKIWAGRLAWPESGIKALRYVGRTDLIEDLNRDYMYAAFSIYYNQYFMLGLKNTPNKIKWMYYLVQILLAQTIRVCVNKVRSLFDKKSFVGRYIKREIYTINEAENFLSEIMNEFNINNLKEE